MHLGASTKALRTKTGDLAGSRARSGADLKAAAAIRRKGDEVVVHAAAFVRPRSDVDGH